MAVLVIGGVGWWGLSGPSAADPQVQLEATSTTGPSPFTAPVGSDQPGVSTPPNAQGNQQGNTGGLYAQDPANPSCDTASLVSQLTADPAKAAAWGQPLGVDPRGIGRLVTSLTPVSLRADTALTEYGYAGGQFQPYPATLQAGTAVLVNSFGEPTVKCFNGDPLGRATSSNQSPRTAGITWTGFDPDRVIQVTPAPAPQGTLTVINQGTGQPQPTTLPPTTQTTPNPGPATGGDGKLLLTGTHNYDGTITLSDGTIIDAKGNPVPPRVNVTHPPGSSTFPDGSIKEPDPPAGSGLIFNKDGTQRSQVTANPNVFNIPVQVNPDGSTTPHINGLSVVWNYDGTFVVFFAGAQGGSQVITVGPDGQIKKAVTVPPGSFVRPDGSVQDQFGNITNPNGTPRLNQTLPGGMVLGPDGLNTPPPDAEVAATLHDHKGHLGTPNGAVNGQGQQNQLPAGLSQPGPGCGDEQACPPSGQLAPNQNPPNGQVIPRSNPSCGDEQACPPSGQLAPNQNLPNGGNSSGGSGGSGGSSGSSGSGSSSDGGSSGSGG